MRIVKSAINEEAIATLLVEDKIYNLIASTV